MDPSSILWVRSLLFLLLWGIPWSLIAVFLTRLLRMVGIDEQSIGDGWNVAGQEDATQDHTLIRRSFVQQPDEDWASAAGSNRYDSQWAVFPIGTLGLGSHTMDPVYTGSAATYSLLISEYVEGSSNNKAIELYNLGMNEWRVLTCV
jgi:hypothetical protein